jgi:hypothetical protein
MPLPMLTEDMPTNIITGTPELTIYPLTTEASASTESSQISAVPIVNPFCTLTIKNEEVAVLNSVEKEMLKQHPN